jgi:hypothetical protein
MTADIPFARLRNGTAVPRRDVPDRPFDEFRRAILDGMDRGWRVSALFADAGAGEPARGVDLYVVLADRRRAWLRIARTRLEADTFASLTPECPQVHLFEREMAE